MRRQDNIKIKFKRNNTLTIIITSAFIVGIMIIGVKLGASSVHATSGDEIVSLQQERQSLVEQNKELETTIAENESIPHIQQVATEKLGMVKAKPVVYLNLDQK